MDNLSSYCGLVDAKIWASDKYLPVPLNHLSYSKSNYIFDFFLSFYSHNGTVTVYTGTYNILQYPDKNKNMQSIYLMEKDNKWYIPAPKYYWKLLLNEVTKEAVAFVGLNDPHADDIPLDQAFCQTSCGSIKG